MTSRASARFSTYSGAPSIQPSLAPTYASSHPSARNSQTTTSHLHPDSATTNPSSTDEKQPYNPAAATSTSTLSSTDPKAADIKSWSGALERMQDERLDKQRYTMSSVKSDEVSKLALGAKVERALSRRMSGQDATFPAQRGAREKRKVVEAN